MLSVQSNFRTLLSSYILLRSMQLKRCYGQGSTIPREARFLKKLMTGSRNSKKKWRSLESPSKVLKEFNFFAASNKIDINKPPELPKIITGAQEPETAKMPSGRLIRRVGVLNTVILDHITSILATGELKGSEDVVGMGLEISYVHVMSDFKLVNVYWYTTGSPEKEARLEEILKHLGPRLRHALITLRVMGVMPPVQFVKDKKQAELMEVERLFENADYGEGFVPTKGANLFRPCSTSSPSSISEEVKEKIEAIEEQGSSQNESQPENSEPASVVPPPASMLDPQFMRQDILGLKRDRILQSVTNLMSKRKQRQNLEKQEPHRDEEQTEVLSSEQLAIDVRNQTARTELFMKYLKLKQIETSKTEKLESTEAYERKFYKELRTERAMDAMKRHAEATEEQLSKNMAKDIEDDYWSESESDDESYREHK